MSKYVKALKRTGRKLKLKRVGRVRIQGSGKRDFSFICNMLIFRKENVITYNLLIF